MPHNHRHVLADWHRRGAGARPAGDRRGARGATRVGELAAAGSRGRVSASGGAADDDVARHAECSDDAGSVEDGDSGRDRFGVGADRLLAIQSALRAGALRGAAAQQPRDVEQRGVPAARGFRLRGHAVQLHVDRRQPSDGAGADGQHGDLEAGIERDAERPLHPRSCSRPRVCRPASSTSWRETRPRSPTSCSTRPIWPGFTSPAAPPSSTRCGSASARTSAAIAATRVSSARPAARTSSSRIASADVQELAVAIVRGGFEYQGQKCSAASRIYVPQSLWPEVKDRAVAMMREIRMGDVADFRTFMGAVIDRKSYTKISGYLDDAKKNAKVIQGGGARDDVGYFVEPTLDRDERSWLSAAVRGDFRAGGHGVRLPGFEVERDARDRGSHVALRVDGRDFRARSRGHPRGVATRFATPPGTSTSTTSPPGLSSVSSRLAARARRAPTTRRARR